MDKEMQKKEIRVKEKIVESEEREMKQICENERNLLTCFEKNIFMVRELNFRDSEIDDEESLEINKTIQKINLRLKEAFKANKINQEK
jgi:hypothetical protein